MESLKDKFILTKNTLFDWNIIETKTKMDKAPSTLSSDKVDNESSNSIIKIEITDIKQNDTLNSHNILDIKNDNNLNDTLKISESVSTTISTSNKVDLRNVDELNSTLNNLIDNISTLTSTIEMLKNKINNLEELSKTNNYNQLSPYLGGLSYPFYNFNLHNYKFDDNVDKIHRL